MGLVEKQGVQVMVYCVGEGGEESESVRSITSIWRGGDVDSRPELAAPGAAPSDDLGLG